MWAWELSGGFGLSNLRRVERPDPTPGPGQVVVQMSAMSLNFRDLLMVEGMYNPKQRLPLIPLSDGVGRVVATGPGVRRVKVGDRVCPTFFQGWTSGEPTMEKLKTPLGGRRSCRTAACAPGRPCSFKARVGCRCLRCRS